MVGVARIELATPAMSTPAAYAKQLIFNGSGQREVPIWSTKWRFSNGPSSN
jgi:hypothetical protein